MQASEAIRLAEPWLEHRRAGVEVADCAIAQADVVVQFSEPARALFVRQGDCVAGASRGSAKERGFWLVTAGLIRHYRDGRPLDFTGHAESVSVFIDDVTGDVVERPSL